MKDFNDQVIVLWRDYGAVVLLAAGAAGFLLLLGLFIWARVTKKELRPVALAVSMNLALLLNAEGMWVIATDKLRLPPLFAVLVFAVFEICFLTATSLAREQYERTTERVDGRIVKPGHPGPMLYIAALIAVVSGVIVASNAVTGTEKLLRLAVPSLIFLMWWAALTAAGQATRRSRFAYGPRRLAERWGWLIPDDDPDLKEMAAKRAARRLVLNHYRLQARRWPASLWRWRIFKDARTADDAVVEQVRAQIDRTESIMVMLLPRTDQHGVQDSERTGGQPDADLSAAPGQELSAADGPLAAGVLSTTAGSVPAAGVIEDDVPVRTDAAEAGQPAASAEEATAVAVPAQRGRDAENASESAQPATVGPTSSLWRPAVQRLRDALAETVTPLDMHTMSGRGARQLTALVAPVVPELSRETVLAFIRESYRDGENQGADGLPWGDLLLTPPAAVGSPEWRAAVERLRDALAATLMPDDLQGQSGRGVIQLADELGPVAVGLEPDVVQAFVGDYVLARAGRPAQSSLPWDDLLPEPFEDDRRSDPDRPRTDESLLEEFGEQLEQLRAAGPLSRYRVEQVTGAKARQAERILKVIEQRAETGLSAIAR